MTIGGPKRIAMLLYATTAVVLAACTGPSEPSDRLTLDQLGDVEKTMPPGTLSIDVGPLAPSDSTSFCDAVALAPVRWITDAVFPLQIWIDAFAGVGDTPAPAESALSLLIDFANTRMAWQLGAIDDRPIWGDDQIAASMSVADAAITTCPDLPLVQGLPGTSDTPVAWQDVDPTEIAFRCAGMHRRVEDGVDEFVAQSGRQPRHQMEMEISLPLFFASDFHGIALDNTGAAVAIAVPGGACDLE